MIKVKMLNCSKGRNETTFDTLANINAILYQHYGIELLWHGKENVKAGSQLQNRAETSDYDYLLIGPADFVDKSKSLEESTDWGLENLEKITEGGDYLLWDGFDSTSLVGSYDVFEKSKALRLLKNQLLNNREDYKNPYRFGKHFFGSGGDFNKSYDIPEEKWNKIVLSGTNLGHAYMARQHIWSMKGTGREGYIYDDCLARFFKPSKNKINDVSAVYLADVNKGYEHGFRNDNFYMNHRKSVWDVIKKTNHNYFVSDIIPYKEYLDKLYDSKIAISPFGQGEICYRDFELMQLGTLMIKPDMSMVNTLPNIYVDGKNYISCKYDWSDLEEKIDYVLSNYDDIYENMLINLRRMFMEKYSSQNLCNNLYNIFANLDGVEVQNK